MGSMLEVVSSWVALLSPNALLHGARDEAAVHAAARVVGEPRLAELRQYLTEEPDDRAVLLRSAAIEICIWMAVSDRVVDPVEREVLADLVARAELPAAETVRLIDLCRSALGERLGMRELADIAERADHPVLRELLLALAWQVALADDFVDDLEIRSFERLAGIFGIEAADRERIRSALAPASDKRS
jgi:uncharacterized tellurite resistance protein B-like protein